MTTVKLRRGFVLGVLLAAGASVTVPDADARPRHRGGAAQPAAQPVSGGSSSAERDAVARRVAVVRVAGRRIEAQGADALAWVPGMTVWILEPGGGLPLCEATIRFRHERRVVLEVAEGAPVVPVGAVVEPRWVAEARLYGVRARAGQAPGGKPTAATGVAADAHETPPWQVWHERPRKLAWGKSLWLELVATTAVQAPHVRWRVGRSGAFRDQAMTAASDGRWTTSLQPGQTAPSARVLQYYVGAKVLVDGTTTGQVIVAHAAHPHEVAIESVPRLRHRSVVDHQPPSRWTHKRAIVLSARIDKRYQSPVVFFRPRGGGTFDVVKMTRISPEVWRATVPGHRVVVPGLSYYLAATDEHGVTRPIFRSPGNPMHVRVTRGRILSTDQRRDRLSVAWTRATHGVKGDAWQRADVGLERLFFGFLVGRLGATATWGDGLRLDRDEDGVVKKSPKGEPLLRSQPINLYGGHAGLELRAGDYLRGSGDLLVAIHNGGAGLGYRLAAHVGDEAGANLFASWSALHDVDDGALLLERLRLGLSTPIGMRLRLAGVVVHESVLQDSSKALRFQVEVTWALAKRLFVTGRFGFSGRDADNPGATGGAGVALTF